MVLKFAFDREAGKSCGIIQCDPLVLKGIERTVSKSPLFPFPYSQNNGNCMLAAASHSSFILCYYDYYSALTSVLLVLLDDG